MKISSIYNKGTLNMYSNSIINLLYFLFIYDSNSNMHIITFYDNKTKFCNSIKLRCKVYIGVFYIYI